jgi:hypothetical protein
MSIVREAIALLFCPIDIMFYHLGKTRSAQVSVKLGDAQSIVNLLPKTNGEVVVLKVFSPETWSMLCIRDLGWAALLLDGTTHYELGWEVFGGGNGLYIEDVALEGDEGRIFLRWCACLHSLVSIPGSCRQSMVLKVTLYSMFILCMLVAFWNLRCGAINLMQGYNIMF